jgi:hypothetical protein
LHCLRRLGWWGRVGDPGKRFNRPLIPGRTVRSRALRPGEGVLIA